LRTSPDLEIPGDSARDAVAWLAECQQRLIQELRHLDDRALDAKRSTNWVEEWPPRELFRILIA
jgi:hypothetical protein